MVIESSLRTVPAEWHWVKFDFRVIQHPRLKRLKPGWRYKVLEMIELSLFLGTPGVITLYDDEIAAYLHLSLDAWLDLRDEMLLRKMLVMIGEETGGHRYEIAFWLFPDQTSKEGTLKDPRNREAWTEEIPPFLLLLPDESKESVRSRAAARQAYRRAKTRALQAGEPTPDRSAFVSAYLEERCGGLPEGPPETSSGEADCEEQTDPDCHGEIEAVFGVTPPESRSTQEESHALERVTDALSQNGAPPPLKNPPDSLRSEKSRKDNNRLGRERDGQGVTPTESVTTSDARSASSLRDAESQAVVVPSENSFDPALLSELSEYGISDDVAQEWMARYPAAYLREQLTCVRLEHPEEARPGLLRRFVERGWKPGTKARRAQQERQTAQRRHNEKAAERAARETAAREEEDRRAALDARYEAMAPAERAAVDQAAVERLTAHEQQRIRPLLDAGKDLPGILAAALLFQRRQIVSEIDVGKEAPDGT